MVTNESLREEVDGINGLMSETMLDGIESELNKFDHTMLDVDTLRDDFEKHQSK